MSYRSLTSFQPPFAPQTAAKREPTRPTSSNLNPIRDPASAPSRKGKERATEQDELAWERDRPHLKCESFHTIEINLSLVELTTLPTNAGQHSVRSYHLSRR